MTWRHEWKHEISLADLVVIRQRMRAIGKLDPHAKDGSYLVRSLYFDNLANRALRDKLDGVDHREKWRLRYYDGNTSLIHLERKTKAHGLGRKDICVVRVDEVEELLAGRTLWMRNDDRPLVRALAVAMTCEGMRPRTIVDYRREPFVVHAGNTRITLDYHIRTGLTCLDFLNPQAPTIPVPGDPIILEVKWDEFLPSVVRDAVQLTGRRTTSYSKYASARSFD